MHNLDHGLANNRDPSWWIWWYFPSHYYGLLTSIATVQHRISPHRTRVTSFIPPHSQYSDWCSSGPAAPTAADASHCAADTRPWSSSADERAPSSDCTPRSARPGSSRCASSAVWRRTARCARSRARASPPGTCRRCSRTPPARSCRQRWCCFHCGHCFVHYCLATRPDRRPLSMPAATTAVASSGPAAAGRWCCWPLPGTRRRPHRSAAAATGAARRPRGTGASDCGPPSARWWWPDRRRWCTECWCSGPCRWRTRCTWWWRQRWPLRQRWRAERWILCGRPRWVGKCIKVEVRIDAFIVGPYAIAQAEIEIVTLKTGSVVPVRRRYTHLYSMVRSEPWVLVYLRRNERTLFTDCFELDMFQNSTAMQRPSLERYYWILCVLLLKVIITIIICNNATYLSMICDMCAYY